MFSRRNVRHACRPSLLLLGISSPKHVNMACRMHAIGTALLSPFATSLPTCSVADSGSRSEIYNKEQHHQEYDEQPQDETQLLRVCTGMGNDSDKRTARLENLRNSIHDNFHSPRLGFDIPVQFAQHSLMIFQFVVYHLQMCGEGGAFCVTKAVRFNVSAERARSSNWSSWWSNINYTCCA
eukprot:Polyplicarium_translucidae@DN2581_c0_g1_i3.p2